MINKKFFFSMMTQFITTRLDYYKALSLHDGTCCAADLLNMFEQWASKEAPGHWFKARQQDLAEKLGELYGKDAIAQATQLLDQLDIVRRHHHTRDGQIHTFYYEFVPDGLAHLLESHRQLAKLVRSLVSVTCDIICRRCFPFLKLYSEANSDFSASQKENSKSKPEAPTAQAEQPDLSLYLYIDPQSSNPLKINPHSSSTVAVEKNFEGREKPTQSQLEQVRQELRTIDTKNAPPINPDRCMSVIICCWRNVPGAIAYIKEAIQTWRHVNSPIAVFIKACKQGLRPKAADRYGAVDRQRWWDTAGLHFGKERRNQLLQSVIEYAGEVLVFFTNGKQISLAEAQEMTWEEIAVLGGEL